MSDTPLYDDGLSWFGVKRAKPDSLTPKYDAMVEAVGLLHRNMDRIALRITDPVERLRYYATIAAGMRDAETKLVQIRRRGERNLNRLLREGVIPRCDQK